MCAASVSGEGGALASPVGTITLYQQGAATYAPYDVAACPDGNMWFTKLVQNEVGRLTPEGVVTSFTVADTGRGIAAGPDGNMWFALQSSIGRITMDGVVSMFGPTASGPAGIGAGPDGGMWFANVNTSNSGIGRVTAVLVPDAPSGGWVWLGMAGRRFPGRRRRRMGPVTGYVVKASPGGQSCVWSSGPLGCTVTGLSNGVSYTFSVKASSAGGTGPASPSSAPVLVGSPNLFVTNGGPGVAIGRSVAPLADGGAVVAGQFQGDVSFGGTVLTPQGGGFNGFVAKFSATGEAGWARSIVSVNDVVPVGAAVDPVSGDVSVTGTFSGTATLDGTAVVSAGGVDGLVARYSPTGALLWARQFGGSGNDTATGVAGLVSGGVAVAANAGSAPTQFDETHEVTPLAISTGVVAAYNAAGDVSYVDPVGGQSISQISGVTAGADGTITATGWFIFNAQFGPGGPTFQPPLVSSISTALTIRTWSCGHGSPALLVAWRVTAYTSPDVGIDRTALPRRPPTDCLSASRYARVPSRSASMI